MKHVFYFLLVWALPLCTGSALAATNTLIWSPCLDGSGECATFEVPRNYAKPKGKTFRLALVRFPATQPNQRIGPLFINFGGPGGSAVAALKATSKVWFSRLNEHFDLIGVDPRGVGSSTPNIGCGVNQESQGLYAQPFITPTNFDRQAWVFRAKAYASQCLKRNPSVLAHINTANVARDMDAIRKVMGESQISYLGYSYGTYLGATYAALFPGHYRAMVLDGPVDPDIYAKNPRELFTSQAAGIDRGLSRFFMNCASDQISCMGFGGLDPWSAFDSLVRQAEVSPLPARGEYTAAVDGNDIIFVATQMISDKRFWSLLAQALAEASWGDGTLMRELTDLSYGRNSDGTYDPYFDRFFTITAADQRHKGHVDDYAKAGRSAWETFDYSWWNTGYGLLPYRYIQSRNASAFSGPFKADSASPTILVIGTTYDPITPYRWSIAMAEQLSVVRLLTREGDGHCAYPDKSICIDRAVEAYFETGELPPSGLVCPSEEAFGQSTKISAIGSFPSKSTLWDKLDFVRLYLREMR